MKIGFFCYSLSGAGPRVRAQNLITGLAERTSHDPVLVTSTDTSFEHDGVDVHRILSPTSLVDPRTAFKTRRLLSDCDIVHVPVNVFQLAYVSALGLGPRVAGAGIQHEPRYRLLTRVLGIERMIETHEFIAREWQSSGVPATYIYPAVNTDIFRPPNTDSGEPAALRSRLEIPEHHDMVLFVGELKPLKGAEVVSELARRLQDDDISVVVVGDGERRHLFENRSDLIFEGFVENNDLPPYYRAADVTVVPSENESFSIVSLESIASGTPVVTTTSETCTMSRLFRERDTYVWTDRNAEAVAASVRDLLSDSEEYQRQVERGFETIDEMGLSISDALNKYINVYETVADH